MSQGTVKTILITDISSYKAIVIARFIKTHYKEIRIVGADCRRILKRIHTKHVDDAMQLPRPIGGGQNYISALQEAIRNRDVDVLMPVSSSEIRILMESRELFGNELSHMGEREAFRVLDDKARFYRLLGKLSLPHPKVYDSLDSAPLPLVAKPRIGSSAGGVFYLKDRVSLARYQARHGKNQQDVIMQEFIKGQGVGFSGFFQDGEILTGYAHQRVAEFPATGGSSVIRSGYSYPDLERMIEMVGVVAREVRWTGFAMFEFKRTKAGELFFIECNPRVWGSMHQGLAAGVNYFHHILGEPDVQPQVWGGRTELFPLSWVSLGQSLIGLRMYAAMRTFKALCGNRLDVNPMRDLGGFISMLARLR
ncbi:MAG: ATP-grasp domain-containing protein [Candidatus Eutrophobiaceae bacterium]